VPRELDSGNVAGNGGFYSHTFSTAGGYPYHCSIPGHSAMVGTVTVSDSDPDTALTVNFPPSTSAFPAASVKTGGRVTWVNNTGMTHTVTSD
jgi:plastocyanin